MIDPRSLLPHLIREEGEVAWMYRDNAPEGNVTVGIGCLIPGVRDAIALPFANMTEERPATPDEIGEDFRRVMRLPPGLAAHAYRATVPPALELPESAVDDLTIARINTVFLPGLRALLENFDAMPDAAQTCLADMAFNLGMSGLAKFPALLDSCRRGDFFGASSECHVKTSRESRNSWRRSQFLLAAT